MEGLLCESFLKSKLICSDRLVSRDSFELYSLVKKSPAAGSKGGSSHAKGGSSHVREVEGGSGIYT